MRYRHQSVILLIVCLVLSATLSYGEPAQWAEKAVLWLQYEEIVNSTLFPDGSEQREITREQFCELAVRLYATAKNISVDQIGYATPFSDTQNPMVGRAYSLGIVKGLTATTFGPTQKITREQLATMLYREIQLLGQPVLYTKGTNFSDHPSLSSYAVDAVYFCRANGFVNGVGQNRFAPKSNTTIEQAQLIVFNILKTYHWTDPVVYDVSRSFGAFKIPAETEISISSDTTKGLILRLVLPVKGEDQTWRAEKNHWESYGILRSHKDVTYSMAKTLLMVLPELWDSTLQQYVMKPPFYIDRYGKVVNQKPQTGLMIRVESSGTLLIDVQIP